MSGQARVGVDIGGTFTDVALEIAGRIHSTKVLTDYASLEGAIVSAIATVNREAGIGFSDLGLVVHGTTLATNALIERRGAKTAFVTTRGFRDVVEMRTENRFELYDLDIVLPPPLVARRDRHVVDERIDAKGNVLKALDPDELARLADAIADEGYESVAVGLIHAYARPDHEIAVRDALLRRKPDLAVSLSCEVSPQMREFQRFNTVCANAYVKPLMASYLGRLVEALRREGATCPVTLIHSGGGIISVESAAAFPVRLLESGPAGGAIFAADVAARYGLDRVLSYDMGGTTAKICLIEDGLPKTAKTFEVARTYRFKKGSGMPISIPVIEMVEIGAGGGSIASVDGMGQIRVGPHSAGSEPGPACYGRGGTKPTVTDADVLLGRIDPATFAGGAMTLSAEASAAAVSAEIGGRLGVDAVEAAFGLCEVVDETMANAARMHAVESGKELSDYTMIAFGGAAPLHAARICEKLGIREFLVPPGAGVGSAIGFLRAPVAFEAVRSAYVRLRRFDAAPLNAALADLEEEATRFVRAAAALSPIETECTAYIRYVGQGWEIPVPVPIRTYTDEDAGLFREAFTKAYEALFGRSIDGLDAEIVSWSLRASSPLPPPPPTHRTDATADAPPNEIRRIFDSRHGEFRDAALVERSALRPGDRVAGPAAIVERETTTIVSSAFDAVLQPDGCLLVSRKPAP